MAKRSRKKKMMGGSMLSDPKTKMYAEGGKASDLMFETNAYIEAEKLLAAKSTPKDRKVQAQITLDSLKPTQQGGNMDPDMHAQMMQEVNKQTQEAKKAPVKKAEGGSMLMPPERQTYQVGSLARILTTGGKALIAKAAKNLPKKEIDTVIEKVEERVEKAASQKTRLASEDSIELQESILTDPTARDGFSEEQVSFTIAELAQVKKELDDPVKYAEYLDALIEQRTDYVDDMLEPSQAEIAGIQADELTTTDRAFGDMNLDFLPESTISNPAGVRTNEQGNVAGISGIRRAEEGAMGRGSQADVNEFMPSGKETDPIRGGRAFRAEGGSMLVPPEMEGAPVDTYPNIPPEEMAAVEASQLPDAEVEDNYIDYVMSEALEQEEQSYLMTALEADPQLSMIFDKVVDTASEFSGAGPVDGPGDGVSDSIPARLSAGEFVVTKKATDQIGADQLQTMMDDAERAYDGGLMQKSNADEEEGNIKQSMLSSNQMPSLNIRER
jgi:hypothetical protein